MATPMKIERRHEEPWDQGPSSRVRDADLEPHAGLRYIARLFKVLAVLLVLLLVAEVIMGLVQQGAAALPTLLVEATRLIVFAALLWAAGDVALMVIDANHDLRALRILMGRVSAQASRMAGNQHVDPELPPLPRDELGPPPGETTAP
ncbi:MAG TPA: hypothetical protein VF832_16615 [Longimicrobiales bacterium]